MKPLPATREVTIARTHLFTFRANGIPKGQPRPRAFSRGGKAAVYDPGTAEGWKSAVAESARDAAGGSVIHPLAVTLTFFMPRPKRHFRTYGGLKNSSPVFAHDNKPDIDNLAKAVLDALTNIRVWMDDDQVCELTARKYWEQPGTCPPGCLIHVSKITEFES